MKTLRDAKIGETVKVVKLHGEGAIKRRIMDMGITKGTDVYVRKVAPLGDPVEVTVRGYELSLRKADAEQSLPRNAGTEKSCLPHLPKRQSRKMSDMSTTSAAPSISAQTSMKSCPLMMSV